MTRTLDLPASYRQQLLLLLEENVPDAEAWAYGSRVKGTNHAGSDLDLVLRGRKLAQLGAEYWDLLNAIEDSTIPILIDVFDWARLPASFLAEIERSHVVLRKPEDCAKQTITQQRSSPVVASSARDVNVDWPLISEGLREENGDA